MNNDIETQIDIITNAIKDLGEANNNLGKAINDLFVNHLDIVEIKDASKELDVINQEHTSTFDKYIDIKTIVDISRELNTFNENLNTEKLSIDLAKILEEVKTKGKSLPKGH